MRRFYLEATNELGQPVYIAGGCEFDTGHTTVAHHIVPCTIENFQSMDDVLVKYGSIISKVHYLDVSQEKRREHYQKLSDKDNQKVN
jgi:hypothetical protein